MIAIERPAPPEEFYTFVQTHGEGYERANYAIHMPGGIWGWRIIKWEPFTGWRFYCWRDEWERTDGFRITQVRI